MEDQKFYQHKGVDFKALCRALLSRGRKIPFLIKYLLLKIFHLPVVLLLLSNFSGLCLLKI
ncbi:hypothetical protein B6672_000245 [Campylobacter jejuni]